MDEDYNDEYYGHSYDTIGGLNDGLFDFPITNATEKNLVAESENIFYLDAGISAEIDIKLLQRSILLANNPSAFWKEAQPPSTDNIELEGDRATTTAIIHGQETVPVSRNIHQPTSGASGRSVTQEFDGPEKSATTFQLTENERHASPMERAALDREYWGNLKSLTRAAKTTLCLCAVAAAAQGMVQETIVGANLRWPAAMGLATFRSNGGLQFEGNGLELFSLVNAIPYLAAGLFGAWLSDPLTYAFGRRATLFIAGFCTLAAAIGAYYSQLWYHLLICRIIQGIGIGSKSSVVPIIIAETYSRELRGRLLIVWQASVAFGIFLGSCTNIMFNYDWRSQVGICFASALPLMSLCFAVPESPRWLIKRGHYRAAVKALLELRETPLQAARDFVITYKQLCFERQLLENTLRDSAKSRHKSNTASWRYNVPRDMNAMSSFFWRFGTIFRIKRVGRAAVAACIVMFAQQACGINLFAFLAATIIQQSDIQDENHRKALFFNIGFGAANFIASAMTFWVFEYWPRSRPHYFGRRSLLLLSLVFMIPFLIGTGIAMDRKPPDLATVAVLVVIYTFIYSPGAGVVPFMYAAEVFPQDFREVGMSAACSVNFIFAFVLAMAVPQFTEVKDGSESLPRGRYSRLFGAFAAINFGAALAVWVFMRAPDPISSLGDMNILFSAKLGEFVKYQVKEVVPCALHRTPKRKFARWLRDRNEEAYRQYGPDGERASEV